MRNVRPFLSNSAAGIWIVAEQPVKRLLNRKWLEPSYDKQAESQHAEALKLDFKRNQPGETQNDEY